MNQPPPINRPQIIAPWLLVVLIIVVLAGGGYFVWYFWNKSQTKIISPPTTTTTTPSPTTTTTPSASTSTTTTDQTYTNSPYGFTLTFPASWKGYKMKEANFPDSVITYYINIPTTDTSATSDETAEAGYYSPFAITVYTLDQWIQVESSDGPKDTLITKNDQYAFGWSQANGVPPADFTDSEDIKTIIASFKLK